MTAGARCFFNKRTTCFNNGIIYNTNMKLKVVLDTNVLIAGMKSSQGASFKILSLLAKSNIELQLSIPLILEYEAILHREVSHLTTTDIEDFLNYLCKIAVKHDVYYLWRPVLKDITDDFVLELAVKSKAIIVTHNIKHFYNGVQKFNIDLCTPQQFLQLLSPSP